MVRAWHDFFIVAATVSATLVGLLFVGLTLHLRVVVTRADVRGLARATLANYALVLLLSLFTLIPERQSTAALEVIVSGVVTLAVMVPSVSGAMRSHVHTLPVPRVLMRFGVGAAACAAAIAAGGLLAAGSVDHALDTLAAVVITLLIVSLRNSWDLLVVVGAATIEP